MKNRFRISTMLFAALLALQILPARAQQVDDLVFLTEDYPPFNFERNGKKHGIAVDVLAEMLAIAGSRKTRDDIKVWPWARAYETALKEKNTVLFSTTRIQAREELFKWVGPIMPSRIVLVARKASGIRIRSEEELRQSAWKVGAVREDVGSQLLMGIGVERQRLLQANGGSNIAKMLHAGRVDLWAYDAQVIGWNLKELGYPSNDYEEVFTLSESQSYFFALNKDTDDRVVAQLQSALEQVKAKGRFNAIVARYR